MFRGKAWDVLLVFAVCPCGMNKEMCFMVGWAMSMREPTRSDPRRHEWQANGRRSRRGRGRHYPAATSNDRSSPPVGPRSSMASARAVSARSTTRRGINLICMLANEDVMLIDSGIVLPQLRLLRAAAGSASRAQQVWSYEHQSSVN